MLYRKKCIRKQRLRRIAKMKIMKTALSVLIAMAVIISAAGCKAKSSEKTAQKKVVLNVLFNNTDENVVEEMKYVMDRLPEVLPNVEAKLEMVPGDAQTYETKVRTMIAAGGSGIDVWWERGGSFATSILKSNSALALDQYLDANGYWDQVIPSAKLPAEDGKIYAVPFEDIAYEILLYNKRIFAQNNLQVPKTAAELKTVVEKLAKTANRPYS